MKRKQVAVVVNKWWECDPVMNVLLHDDARPKELLPWPALLRHPRERPKPEDLPAENFRPLPRAAYNLPNVSVEMWCISDLLEHLADRREFQSSSQRKMEQLPKVFQSGLFDLVIAVGTAGYPQEVNVNGSVVIGTQVFMHNSHPNGSNQFSDWNAGPFDTVLNSSLSREAFQVITDLEPKGVTDVATRFMVPPFGTSEFPRILVKYDAVALAAVNVTQSAEYDATDKDTVSAFSSQYDATRAQSLETTHGLIRVAGGESFLFISGITDRVGHFSDEVRPREYAQKMSAAHNAGIVLAWMLPRVASLFRAE